MGASINVLPSIAARLAAPPETSVDLVPLDLPTVLVPPEMTDLEMLTAVKHAPSNSGLKGDEGVGYNGVRLSLKLFDDDVRPPCDEACADAGSLFRRRTTRLARSSAR